MLFRIIVELTSFHVLAPFNPLILVNLVNVQDQENLVFQHYSSLKTLLY